MADEKIVRLIATEGRTRTLELIKKGSGSFSSRPRPAARPDFQVAFTFTRTIDEPSDSRTVQVVNLGPL